MGSHKELLREDAHSKAQDVEEIDWATWVPTERAVLCFVRRENQVLLIHKKTGLGAGKVNAPGGRIEPGESPLEAAVRETQEEVCITPLGLYEVGSLFFHFTDGYRLHGTVFFAEGHSGEPGSTREADPFWCRVDALPWDQMWEDDSHWLPHALEGARIDGYFIFDGDRMVSKRVGISARTAQKKAPMG